MSISISTARWSAVNTSEVIPLPGDIGLCWDFEDCPRGWCDGQLEQQDRYNVMCLKCEAIWGHTKDETTHYLTDQHGENVAEKPRVVTDGGGNERDGWWFTAEIGGRHQTRHEAIGAAAVAARERLEARGGGYGPTPLEATRIVYAYKPYFCGYCGETFLTHDEAVDHTPCPYWVEAGEAGVGDS